MPQITLTLDLTPENTAVLCEVLPRFTLKSSPIKNKATQLNFSGAEANAAPTDMKVDTPTTDKGKVTSDSANKKGAVANEKAAADTSQGSSVTENPSTSKTPSMTDIRAVALKFSKAGKQDILKKLFAKYGADKLSGVAEEHYPELMKDLEASNVEA